MKIDLDELEKRLRLGVHDVSECLDLIRQARVMREALYKCKSLTFQWVMAEHTINCRHSYGEIRETADKAIDQLEGCNV